MEEKQKAFMKAMEFTKSAIDSLKKCYDDEHIAAQEYIDACKYHQPGQEYIKDTRCWGWSAIPYNNGMMISGIIFATDEVDAMRISYQYLDSDFHFNQTNLEIFSHLVGKDTPEDIMKAIKLTVEELDLSEQVIVVADNTEDWGQFGWPAC